MEIFVDVKAMAPLWIAMILLYGLLGLVTLVVAKPLHSSLHNEAIKGQVTSWWRLFPWISTACITFPLGAWAVVLLIGGFVARELWMIHRPSMTDYGIRVWVGVAILIAVHVLGVWLIPGWLVAVYCVFTVVVAILWLLLQSQAAFLASLFFLQGAALWTIALWDRLPIGRNDLVAWYFLLMVVTATNDIGQFVAGKMAGRRKLAARVSPNKTWEGVWGGMLVSLGLSVSLGQAMRLAPVSFLVCLGLGLSVAGIAGDLLFSAAKRYLGIKDFSRLIPGHGGMLDRVDSLVLTAPFLYLVLRFMPPNA